MYLSSGRPMHGNRRHLPDGSAVSPRRRWRTSRKSLVVVAVRSLVPTRTRPACRRRDHDAVQSVPGSNVIRDGTDRREIDDPDVPVVVRDHVHGRAVALGRQCRRCRSSRRRQPGPPACPSRVEPEQLLARRRRLPAIHQHARFSRHGESGCRSALPVQLLGQDRPHPRGRAGRRGPAAVPSACRCSGITRYAGRDIRHPIETDPAAPAITRVGASLEPSSDAAEISRNSSRRRFRATT